MQSQQLLVTIRSKFEKVENGKKNIYTWIANEIVISFTRMMNIEREDCLKKRGSGEGLMTLEANELSAEEEQAMVRNTK